MFSGDNFGLVGKSGCGKSTLSRLLSWIEPPDSGHILFEGEDIGAMTNGERFRMRRRFQLVLQDPFNCIPPHMPVGKSIGIGVDFGFKVGLETCLEDSSVSIGTGF